MFCFCRVCASPSMLPQCLCVAIRTGVNFLVGSRCVCAIDNCANYQRFVAQLFKACWCAYWGCWKFPFKRTRDTLVTSGSRNCSGRVISFGISRLSAEGGNSICFSVCHVNSLVGGGHFGGLKPETLAPIIRSRNRHKTARASSRAYV